MGRVIAYPVDCETYWDIWWSRKESGGILGGYSGTNEFGYGRTHTWHQHDFHHIWLGITMKDGTWYNEGGDKQRMLNWNTRRIGSI